jgi:hypothetical protein
MEHHEAGGLVDLASPGGDGGVSAASRFDVQAIGLLSAETAESTSAEPRVAIRLGDIATVAFGSQTRSR